ncbi:MAG: ABC transporter permease [Pseudomonadota bacterium]
MTDTSTIASRPFGRFERSLSWRYLRARREHGGASLISIISFVGIALAVAALIVTMSIMGGFRTTLINALVGGEEHIAVYIGERATEEGALDFAEIVRGIDGVRTVAPSLQAEVLVEGYGATTGARVRGVRPEDLANYPALDLESFTGYGEGRNGGNTVLVGKYLARRLGLIKGSPIVIFGPKGAATPFGSAPGRKKEYVVGGLIDTGSVDLDNLYIFMPFEQAQLFFNERDQVQRLDVRIDDIYQSPEIMQKIFPLRTGPFGMDDWQQRNGSYLGALGTERGLMRIIMLILITITSLNIITGVVMLVKNKTRDIAILRTIGAGRNAIMRVFVMIGATLGFAGAVTGLLLGVLIVLNIDAVEAFLDFATGTTLFPADVYKLDGLPAELDWREAIFTTLWAVAMSILVTIWPARAAARMDPVEALRFE